LDEFGHDLVRERRQEADRVEPDPGFRWPRPVRGAHEAEERGDLAPELGPIDDAVNEAVLEEEFGPLEAGRQLLGDGSGCHAGTGKADERVRLGKVHVAEHRVGGKDPPGRPIAHDADVRDAGHTQALERRDGLRELHERERALLHPGAPGGGDHDEGDPLGQRILGGPGDLLAHDGAHRAAHESEVHDANGDGSSLDQADPAGRSVPQPGRELGCRDSLGVGLLVHETERIDGLQAGVALLERSLVEEELETRRGRKAEVVAAGRAHPVGLVELLVEEHLRARRAFRPQVGRIGVLAGPEGGQLDRHRGYP